MKRLLSAACLALAAFSTAAAAQQQRANWQDRTWRLTLHDRLNALADDCSGLFGFTRRPRQDGETMERRIHAALLLDRNPDYLFDAIWLSYTRTQREARHAAANAVRARSNAILMAAQLDPSTRERAERTYVAVNVENVRTLLYVCSEGARDRLIGAHYLTGQGSTAPFEAMLRADFANGLANRPAD
jgi:hypothetical protein